MELRRYASLAIKWWWLMILGVVLAGGSAFVVSSGQPAVYRATATLMIREAQDSQRIDYNSLITSERLTRTYAELIRKTPALAGAIEKLRLPYSTGQLAGAIQVVVIRDTQLLQVSAEHSDRQLARDIANVLSEVFIAQRLEDQVGLASASREILQQQIADLERDLKNTTRALGEAKASRAPQSDEITRLQNMLAQQQVTYSQLVRSEQDMRLSEARTLSSVKLVEPAGLPTLPVRPLIPRDTLSGALIGLILALAAAFLIEYLDDTVKSAADVQRAVELATLGTVGRIPIEGRAADAPRLLKDIGPRSSLGEAYRILRANVDFAWAGEPGKIILITSANPHEGKTTTLANLGQVLAKDSRSVVLVDADLRRPSLHQSLGMEGSRGLTNLLTDPNACVAEFVRPTRIAGLALLASGPIPPNPSELLGSARFKAVLDELRRSADVVLIDTPPALAVADAAVIAPAADGVIIVAEAGKARVQALERAVEVLGRTSARLLGVVLNKATKHAGDYNYYYYHYYHRYYDKPGTSDGADKQRQTVEA